MSRSSVLLLLALSVACSSTPNKVVTTDPAVSTATRKIGGNFYSTLEFATGSDKLSDSSKKQLQALVEKLKTDKRDVEEIKILAWADKEYPEVVENDAPAREVILANERAKNIRGYLKKELTPDEQINYFNMAKRPNLFSKLVQSEDYEVKEAFERSGATGVRLDDGSMSYSKASKAIIVIDYDDAN